MAYCKQCGAYIPDGLSACLACGFDENAKADEHAAAAAAKESKNEDLRRKLEEQRRVQQEANRRWAEQEQARRKQQEEESRRQAEMERERRQRQEESRRWAEEEHARRQAEKEQQERSAATAYRSVLRDSTGESNKLFAALSYISFLFVLPYILAPQDEFAKFHAKQGLRLFIFSILADALGAITGFGWIVTLLRLYFIYKGMTNAFNGRWEKLPYIGNIGS